MLMVAHRKTPLFMEKLGANPAPLEILTKGRDGKELLCKWLIVLDVFKVKFSLVQESI